MRLALQTKERSKKLMRANFFWSGVGFATKTGLVGKLWGLPKGINDHFMTLTLPFSCNKHVTIISGNALTMVNSDEVIICSTMIWKVLFIQHHEEKLILRGDLNSRVGTDYQNSDGVIGSVGICKCNSNDLLL